MSIVDITPRLTEVITVRRQVGHDGSGDPVFAPAFLLPARIERGVQEEADAEGRRLGNSTRIFTKGEMQAGDNLWLPEDDITGDGRRPVDVSKKVALDGTVSHWTTIVG